MSHVFSQTPDKRNPDKGPEYSKAQKPRKWVLSYGKSQFNALISLSTLRSLKFEFALKERRTSLAKPLACLDFTDILKYQISLIEVHGIFESGCCCYWQIKWHRTR